MKKPPFSVRFLIALFLPLYLWLMMWALPSLSGLFWFLSLPAGFYTYFYPTVEAKLRGSTDTLAIGLLNLFFGWTVVVWVICLVWSVRIAENKSDLNSTDKNFNSSPKNIPSSIPVYKPTLREDPKTEVKKTKQCPFCAEEVMQAAVICKHCRSDLSKVEVPNT
jgi:hypothetical protein